MAQIRYCSQCGHANKSDAQFCGTCGYMLPMLSRLPTVPIFNKTVPGASRRVRLYSIGIVALLTVITGILLLTEGCIAGLDLFRRCLPQVAITMPLTNTPTPPPTVTAAPSKTPSPIPTNSATPRNTATPAPTATMMPAMTPLPSPTPSPASATILIQAYRYIPISLDAIHNATLDFADPPAGIQELGGIPFVIGSGVFKSQASTPPFDHYATRAILPVSVPQAQSIHLLINAGNGYNRFLNQIVGKVTVTCDNQTYLVRELELGRDLREWHTAANVVSQASAVIPVWEGATPAGALGFLDMLSLPMPPQCHNGVLTDIEISDDSVSSLNSLDPALNIAAITIETNSSITQP